MRCWLVWVWRKWGSSPLVFYEGSASAALSSKEEPGNCLLEQQTKKLMLDVCYHRIFGGLSTNKEQIFSETCVLWGKCVGGAEQLGGARQLLTWAANKEVWIRFFNHFRAKFKRYVYFMRKELWQHSGARKSPLLRASRVGWVVKNKEGGISCTL